MKLTKIKFCAAITAITFVSGLALNANAQSTWNPGYSSQCSELGGCQHGDDSLELIPFGRSYGYEDNSGRIPYRDSFRVPYQSSLGDYSGGCGYGGSCSQSRRPQADSRYYGSLQSSDAVRCPYQQRQFAQANFDPRLTYGSQSPYRRSYEGNPNIDTRPSYSSPHSAPSQRSFQGFQQAPADRRPELRDSPSFVPESSYRRNERQPQSRTLTVPPTSTQIMPPPQLPPQPSAAKSRQSRPQLLPPTIVPNTKRPDQNHAGHDHSGHENCDHNH